MAEIVLGIGTSHGPMLVTTPEQWLLRIPDDVRNRHPWRGRAWSFDELVIARKGEGLDAQIAPAALRANADRCTAALDRLAEVLEAARVDVAVIVGNDQMEIYGEELIPAFGVVWGDSVENTPFSEDYLSRLPPGIKESIPGYIPTGGATYPIQSELGRHIIQTAMTEGFDVAALRTFPKRATPHAYAFVYRRLMRDVPMPTVPVVLNTFYRPNQPPMSRCIAFGQMLRRAIESWDSSARVAVIASGGLTHFVIDEDLDRRLLKAMASGDLAALVAPGEGTYQAGTSEVKNWAPVAAAMTGLGFRMELVDYVPVYRTAAGTGNAMGFVYWERANG
jgi:3-O-methylgallate 3,4-dioxygenase